MKNIGPTGKPITPTLSKKSAKAKSLTNATKGQIFHGVKSGPNEEIKNQALKLSIHKRLQDIDLSNPEGRRLGREAFIELSLRQEFGAQTPEFLSQYQLVSKIEKGVYQALSIKTQFDKLIASLQKSV